MTSHKRQNLTISDKEKGLKKILLLVLASAVFMGAVSCGNDDRGSGTGHHYGAALCGNPESLDPQFADDSASATVIKNLYSGLVTADEYGNITCCNAVSYDISPDGTVYTFNLRDDNYWYFDKNEDDVIDDDEVFPVTADDYVFALRRVIDPVMQSPYAEYFSCIKGAEKVISGEIPAENAEIYALDNYTLVIVLESANVEFLRLMASQAAMPCNRDFFYSTKGRYGLDYRSVMSNGAFYVYQWFYDPYGVNNILYMRKNKKNQREDFEISPNYLSFTIEKNENDIRQLFRNGEIECFTTLDAESYNSRKYTVSSSRSITLGILFNTKTGYFSNPDIRKAFALTTRKDNLTYENDDICTADGIIPPAVTILGRSYRELSADSIFRKYDNVEAVELFDRAKKNAGFDKVKNVRVLVNADTVNSACMESILKEWKDCFDCEIGIEDVSAEDFDRRISEGGYDIALYPLTADFSGGISFIKAFEEKDFLKNKLSETGLSETLMNCTSINDLVEKYQTAEKLILDEFVFVPLFYKNSYLITGVDNEEIKYDSFSGAVDYRTAKNYS